jgi:hypothetical protein
MLDPEGQSRHSMVSGLKYPRQAMHSPFPPVMGALSGQWQELVMKEYFCEEEMQTQVVASELTVVSVGQIWHCAVSLL